MGKRGTSAGQTESAKVQDEAERQDNPERSEREKEKSPLRSLSGARRTEVLSSPERRRRTGELCTGGRRAERDNGEHADGWAEGRPDETTTCPERGTSAGQVVVSGGSGSARAEDGRAHRFDVVSEAKAGAAADTVRVERGTSAGRTESARAQDEAEQTKILERSIKKSGAKRTDKKHSAGV